MCGTFHANPAVGGGKIVGRLQACLGRVTCLALEGEGSCLPGAGLDSDETGEGEQEGSLSNRLGTPVPGEGKHLAKATLKPVAELAV